MSHWGVKLVFLAGLCWCPSLFSLTGQAQCEVSGVCNLVVCHCDSGLCWSQEKWLNTESRLSLNSHLPPAFHWYSVRAKLSTDWFLQTDAEGDTHSLINWPSRYTQFGFFLTPVSPAMLPFSWTYQNS